ADQIETARKELDEVKAASLAASRAWQDDDAAMRQALNARAENLQLAHEKNAALRSELETARKCAEKWEGETRRTLAALIPEGTDLMERVTTRAIAARAPSEEERHG